MYLNLADEMRALAAPKAITKELMLEKIKRQAECGGTRYIEVGNVPSGVAVELAKEGFNVQYRKDDRNLGLEIFIVSWD
jgi:hypothetical protein